MKHLKVFGLAAIATMGLMMLLGSSSASATALCTNTDTPDCLAQNKYSQGITIDFSAKLSSSIRTTSGGTTIATCAGSTVKWVIGRGGSSTETVSGNVSEWTWTGCNQKTNTVATGSFEIHWIEGTHNGTVTGSASQWTTESFGTTCTYGTGEGIHFGTLVGGASPLLVISTTISKMAGNFLCPNTVGWDAEYEVTEPHALFVTTG